MVVDYAPFAALMHKAKAVRSRKLLTFDVLAPIKAAAWKR